jgi:starch phosphorylase
MKAAMNGVLNFSILDGWWIEGFNGENGFAIGGLDEAGPQTGGESTGSVEADLADAESLYSTLERQVIPTFYSRNEDGLPVHWVRMMKNSIATLTPKFSSDRMVREYLERIYRLNNSQPEIGTGR